MGTGVLTAAAVRERLLGLEGAGLRTFAEQDPIVWSRTEGARVWDTDGREYLDMNGGFAAASIGYCHPRVTAAIVKQAGLMTHCPSASPSELRLAFYQRLIGIAPSSLTRVIPAITGSQATEIAVALARAATGRQDVIAFACGYVGRSSGSVTYAGKPAYRAPLGVAAGAQFLPYPDPYRSPWALGNDPALAVLALLDQYLDDPASGLAPPACILVEPIQGNGGAVVPADAFLQGLRQRCDRVGAVLIFDEIQCGFGRSGQIWAGSHAGVEPDLMTVGKGIGGGLAVSAVLGRESLMGTWSPDAVSSTFLTNALGFAAACASIDVLADEGLVERAAQLGEIGLERLRAGLADVAWVGDIRGRGMLLGVELVRSWDTHAPDTARTAEACRALRERGIIVGRSGRYGNVVKLSPPLMLDNDDWRRVTDEIVDVIRQLHTEGAQ